MLRYLINYLRECFCKHQFEYEEKIYSYDNFLSNGVLTKISATCKKCGYHKAYNKFV